MSGFVTAVSVVLGLAIGSFLNVVIHRLPLRESVVHPPSHCPSCSTPIAPRDNIPVLSWLVLRGRCRHCASPISARYPLVEVVTAVLFGVVAASIGPHPELAAFLVFTAVLVAASGIDLDHHIIPNPLVGWSLVAGFVLLAAAATVDDDWGSFLDALIGGAIFFGVLLVLNLIYPAGMGFGDVKFAAVLGLHLGWIHVGRVPVAMFVSFLLAAVIGVGLIVTGLRGRKDPVPFGPFLACGTLIAVVVGGPILDAYLPG